MRGGGELFDDVYVTLETIYNRGYTMLVASNGKIDYIEAILNSKDIKKYFTYPIVTIDNMIRGKNDIVRYYKETISKNNLLIMIGDRESDMIAAIENGIPFIGCSFGFSENNEFKDLKWRVNRFSKIPCIIRTIEKELR
ncbi:MAG: HAD hydrolase-like protein [Spirochaetota bacterium]|nr:HAD hydrolase-like protein [Spirochaetota bacterium]